MKYSFDVPEITDCYQCPCHHADRTEWDMYCNLYYILNQKDMKVQDPIPDWCPLKQEDK